MFMHVNFKLKGAISRKRLIVVFFNNFAFTTSGSVIMLYLSLHICDAINLPSVLCHYICTISTLNLIQSRRPKFDWRTGFDLSATEIGAQVGSFLC